jgi:hypothetical protein
MRRIEKWKNDPKDPVFAKEWNWGGLARAALKRILRRDGKVALWLYAPGYIDADIHTDHMSDLTGFRFAVEIALGDRSCTLSTTTTPSPKD